MQTFQFRLSDFGEVESMELSDIPTGRRLGARKWSADGGNFRILDGGSVAVSVSTDGAAPRLSFLITTIHGGLVGTH
jgi:hypothetical protein